MNTTPTWVLVLGSAAIGAVVSTVISELGRWRERKARRHEVLLTQATQLAIAWSKTLFDIAKVNEKTTAIPNQVRLTELYYNCLVGIMDKGKIPAHLETKLERH
jgi:Zn-dependent protease with chaperone function